MLFVFVLWNYCALAVRRLLQMPKILSLSLFDITKFLIYIYNITVQSNKVFNKTIKSI